MDPNDNVSAAYDQDGVLNAEDLESQRLIGGKKKSSHEDVPLFSAGMSPERLRLGFIRKVYAILAAQLILTCSVSYFFMYKPSVNAFVLDNTSAIMVRFTRVGASSSLTRKRCVQRFPIDRIHTLSPHNEK